MTACRRWQRYSSGAVGRDFLAAGAGYEPHRPPDERPDNDVAECRMPPVTPSEMSLVGCWGSVQCGTQRREDVDLTAES